MTPPVSTPDLGVIRERATHFLANPRQARVEVLAADLAALCDRVAELEAALRPFTFARIEYPTLDDDEILEVRRFNVEPRHQRVLYPSIRMKHVRCARAALAADPPTEGETP